MAGAAGLRHFEHPSTLLDPPAENSSEVARVARLPIEINLFEMKRLSSG
jgi:hypothetical protein